MPRIKRRNKKRRLTMRSMTQPFLVQRLTIYARCDGRCWFCGAELALPDATLDHLRPVADGGQGALDNLVLACRACNNAKGRLSLETYRQRCGGTPFPGEQRRRH